MINPKFALRKIRSVNYKAMFASVRRVSKETGKPSVAVLADLLGCIAHHECGYVDYEDLEMYRMTEAERRKVLTIGRNLRLCRRLNADDSLYKIEDKAAFNRLFADFIRRDWFCLDDPDHGSLEDFRRFLEGKERVIVKPTDQTCGIGIDILRTGDYTPGSLYEKLRRDKTPLVEEVVVQSEKMNAFAPYAVNTIRIISILTGDRVTPVGAGLRLGTEGNVVDNYHHGGITACVDPRTGVIVTDGYDKTGATYVRTPGTGALLKGEKLPLWEEMVALVTRAHRLIPELRYVGWDVALDHDDQPLLIEANDLPGIDVSQLPDLEIGTYAAIKAALGEEL